MNEKTTKSKVVSRPPIVTLLGHVDHGKTTLLDFIRKTNLVKKEAGGITQGIGASIVKTGEGKKITFIDTPGHAAFSKMRARGAKVADIAILVVAANEGVKPQTKEALEYILSTNTPFIVAATKMDLSAASDEKVRKSLEREQVHFEGSGGEVPLVSVSAKTGKGTKELLEMISLVSELNDIKGDVNGTLDAVVIETFKSKAGPLVNIVTRNGVLKVGDDVVAGGIGARVKALFDYQGDKTDKVVSGEPGQILGFSELPDVGSKLVGVSKKSAVKLKEKKPVLKISSEGGYPILIKAKSAGTLEALISNLPQEVSLISSGVGDVTETDVFLAKPAGADIYLFETKVPGRVAKLAKTEGVAIFKFDIIYELFEKLQEKMESEKLPVLGKAEIVQIFPFNKKKVAGCRVVSGKISKDNTLVVMRGERELGKVRIITMRREKEKIRDAKQGEECGIIFTPQLEFAIGDMLISTRKKK